jgi:hypothetical protein
MMSSALPDRQHYQRQHLLFQLFQLRQQLPFHFHLRLKLHLSLLLCRQQTLLRHLLRLREKLPRPELLK